MAVARAARNGSTKSETSTSAWALFLSRSTSRPPFSFVEDLTPSTVRSAFTATWATRASRMIVVAFIGITFRKNKVIEKLFVRMPIGSPHASCCPQEELSPLWEESRTGFCPAARFQ